MHLLKSASLWSLLIGMLCVGAGGWLLDRLGFKALSMGFAMFILGAAFVLTLGVEADQRAAR